MDVHKTARALGVFSVGLGLAEAVAPHALSRLIGVREGAHDGLLRAFGLREMTAGVGLLSGRAPGPWLWGRVAGDALDLAALGAAVVGARNGRRGRLVAATAAVVGVTALDIVAARRASATGTGAATHAGNGAPPDAEELAVALTVGKPVDEVYRLWRTPEILVQVLGHFADVESATADRATLHGRGPIGQRVSWTWEVTEEHPGRDFRFRSVAGTDVPNEGVVMFREAPNGEGTEVHLWLRYRLPGGPLGDAAAKTFGAAPRALAVKTLRRFKSLVETGEMPTLEKNVSARGVGDLV